MSYRISRVSRESASPKELGHAADPTAAEAVGIRAVHTVVFERPGVVVTEYAGVPEAFLSDAEAMREAPLTHGRPAGDPIENTCAALGFSVTVMLNKQA